MSKQDNEQTNTTHAQIRALFTEPVCVDYDLTLNDNTVRHIPLIPRTLRDVLTPPPKRKALDHSIDMHMYAQPHVYVTDLPWAWLRVKHLGCFVLQDVSDTVSDTQRKRMLTQVRASALFWFGFGCANVSSSLNADGVYAFSQDAIEGTAKARAVVCSLQRNAKTNRRDSDLLAALDELNDALAQDKRAHLNGGYTAFINQVERQGEKTLHDVLKNIKDAISCVRALQEQAEQTRILERALERDKKRQEKRAAQAAKQESVVLRGLSEITTHIKTTQSRKQETAKALAKAQRRLDKKKAETEETQRLVDLMGEALRAMDE